jgi:hypothetical protein
VKKSKHTFLQLNGKPGVFYLRTVFGPGAGLPHPNKPGWIIKEFTRAAAGVSFAIQAKYEDGWKNIDESRDRPALRKVFDRDWRRREFKTRFVAIHPEADEPLQLKD